MMRTRQFKLAGSGLSKLRTGALPRWVRNCSHSCADFAHAWHRLTARYRAPSLGSCDASWRTTPANLLKLDLHGHIVDVSDAWLEELDYGREQVLGRHHRDFLDSVANDDELFTAGRETGRASDVPCRLIGADGSRIDTLCTAVWTPASASGGAQVIAYYRNIGERLRLARDLHDEHDFLMVTLHSIGDGVISTDEEGRIRYLNPMAERMIGCHLEQVRHRPFSEVVSLVDQHTGAPIVDPIGRCLAERKRFELPSGTALRDAGGRLIAIDDSVAPIINVDGQLRGAVMVIQDVSEARAAAEHLRYLAHHDTLTRLPNRTALQERLQGLCTRTPASDSPFALVFIDLDRFKEVNDTHGHEMGDRLLRTVSRRLTDCLEPADTVARIGGDEFVLVIEGSARLMELEHVLQRLQDRVATPMNLGGIDIRITLSLGVARFPDDARDASSLMQRADAAMYRAKSAGRHRHFLARHPRTNGEIRYLGEAPFRAEVHVVGMPSSAAPGDPEISSADQKPLSDSHPASAPTGDSASRLTEISAA